ncbi:hypothetical protein T459_13848 [Capsicum annuum]|uniref:X8 domain-containing protein n=1 Tax=Capsicum annuum TaxID=4072 RepID=A0A2G2ZFQ1_CAPAN|nr:hypothetical protein T459_13848 [Capsicum annuum]
MDVLKFAKVPSDADFRDDIKEPMLESLEEFNQTGASFVLCMFPIYFVKDVMNYTNIEFAFCDNDSGLEVQDGNVTYTNVVELMIDSVAWAIKKAGYANMKIVIGEIGWPTDGYLHANIKNAERFHKGLLKFIASEKGTPLRPGSIDIYLHSLSDENKFGHKSGAFQRHWGIYEADGNPKYKIDFSLQDRDLYPTQAKGIVKMPNRWMQTQQLSPAMVVDLLLQNKIPSLRLMTSGYDIIEVFAATNISITITMGNSFMYQANRKDLAYNWVNERIKSPINKGVNIVELTIGSEPFSNTFLKKVSNYEVVNVLKLMRESLDAMDLGYVKTTTAHGMDVLKVSKFPSEADFRDDIKKEMLESLAEFNRTGAPFVLILFPIHFVKEILKYPMEFAFFDNNSGFTIEDGNVTYTNAVELMIDFVAWAIKKAGYPNMKIRIAQIGWPTDGYLHANVQNAERFHRELLKFIVSQKGTPLKPGPMDIYLHSLCDENNFATMFGTFQRHWGIYRADGHPKYKIDFSLQGHDKYPTQAKGIVKMPNRWCIYNGDKSNLELVHKNYELACQAADCTRLEQGGSCDGLNFDSNMSYAWNAFFQKNKQQKGFGLFVELENDFEDLVRAIVGKEGVKHMVVRNILDMEVGKQSILDFESDYGELGYELGLETDGNDDVVFLDVPVLQLQ